MILVHNSVSFKRVKFCTTEFFESIFIQVNSAYGDLTIGSIYNPNTKNSEFYADMKKLLSRPGPFVLAGDWNAKHSNWNNIIAIGKALSY